MNINETDRMIITEALSNLLIDFQESIPHLVNNSSDDVTAHTLAISTAKIKLNKITKDKEQNFSLLEVTVMYWALQDLRAGTRYFLDTTSLSDPDRNTAIETEKTCNRLIRFFRSQFEQAGVSPPDELLLP